MELNRIVIVGGGSSGWITANHLGRALSHRKDISITLIESPDIPNIGVGEGTVPSMVETLKSFGVSETDFIRHCDVTFKQSIKFVNWMDEGRHGKDNYYHHLFEQPFPLGSDVTPYWLSIGRKGRYGDVVSPQSRACELGKAPKRITTPEFSHDLHYAYHMDAEKFSELLSHNAQERFGVKHLQANVLDVTLDEFENIRSLQTDSLGNREYDFFIDCSGFSAFLIGEKLGVPFVEKNDQLLIDRAIVAQVPTTKDVPIPPYTIATAHQAGWIWDIALNERRGTGFVYSSKHMSSDEAAKEFDTYLNGSLGNLNYREIPMRVGYREKFWHKNCVAIGLAQGFVEPLEATAILMADHSASLLATQFPRTTDQISILSKRYNERLLYKWDRIIDFIRLHYYLSDRKDSQFWLDNKNLATVSEHLKEQLQLWKGFSPSCKDFSSTGDVFNVENFLYILYGMNFVTEKPCLPETSLERSKQCISIMNKNAEAMIQALPGHRELIEKIKQFGLGRV